MKHIFALVLISAALTGCATTEMETKQEAPAKPAVAAPAPAAAADAALTKAVEAALAKEPELKGTKVSAAATTDGAVTLSGTVKNDWQLYVAGETAKKTAGVKSVKNSIKVPD